MQIDDVSRWLLTVIHDAPLAGSAITGIERNARDVAGR
jgi:hypothetical protein